MIRPAEAALAVADPKRAVLGYRVAQIAEGWANRLFYDGTQHTPDNTEQNAFKHAFWNGLMVKVLAQWAHVEREVEGAGRVGIWIDDLLGGSEQQRWSKAVDYGVWWAKAFADAHENDALIPFQRARNTLAQRQMDLHNNQVGRNIAAALLKVNPKTLDRGIGSQIMKDLANGRMIVVLPEYDMHVIRNRI